MTTTVLVVHLSPHLRDRRAVVHPADLDDLNHVRADLAAWPHAPGNRTASVRVDWVDGPARHVLHAREVRDIR